jgi:hypothetical protein
MPLVRCVHSLDHKRTKEYHMVLARGQKPSPLLSQSS